MRALWTFLALFTVAGPAQAKEFLREPDHASLILIREENGGAFARARFQELLRDSFPPSEVQVATDGLPHSGLIILAEQARVQDVQVLAKDQGARNVDLLPGITRMDLPLGTWESVLSAPTDLNIKISLIRHFARSGGPVLPDLEFQKALARHLVQVLRDVDEIYRSVRDYVEADVRQSGGTVADHVFTQRFVEPAKEAVRDLQAVAYQLEWDAAETVTYEIRACEALLSLPPAQHLSRR